MTTTLYLPVLIESVEQAEKLPEGAIITQEDRDGPWEKWADGYFRGAVKTVVGPERAVDRIALVPVEAEEETRTDLPGRRGINPVRRLVTRWEPQDAESGGGAALAESSSVVHEDPHPYAGQVVPLLVKGAVIGGDEPAAMFAVQDWADRVFGAPWHRVKSMGTWLFRTRARQLGLPLTDDNVLYGRLGGIPLLVHTREIDWSRL